LTAGITTSALGVAGIVTGVVMNLKANAMVADMENQLGAYSTGKENDQKTYRTVAWVGYGVGAAGAVAGAVLIGLGLRSGTTDVAFSPTVAPGQVGAMLAGGF
jgi:hypothetical protein